MSRYIDADALYMDVIHRYDYCDDFIEMIEQCPTADVKPNVHGEWILDHPSQLWECTNCHEREIRTTDFCPWCGADTRKGETNG